jgi:hypothetical protein
MFTLMETDRSVVAMLLGYKEKKYLKEGTSMKLLYGHHSASWSEETE